MAKRQFCHMFHFAGENLLLLSMNGCFALSFLPFGRVTRLPESGHRRTFGERPDWGGNLSDGFWTSSLEGRHSRIVSSSICRYLDRAAEAHRNRSPKWASAAPFNPGLIRDILIQALAIRHAQLTESNFARIPLWHRAYPAW